MRHAAALLLLALAGCVSPAAELDHEATRLGLQRTVVRGEGFEHVVYRNAPRDGDVLHVYLDGDGTPWLGGIPTSDPTPRDPLVLMLLAQDPAPAVYLGRPCYGSAPRAPGCGPKLWTRDRWGPVVLASLTAALRRLLVEGGYSSIAWYGHSGGGTLAVLLAPSFAESRSVTTVGAVLNVRRWAAESAREDLGGSLDPAQQPALPAGIAQQHYAGGADPVVPPALTAAAARRLGSDLQVIPTFDHICCWREAWPDILARADAARAAQKLRRSPTSPP